MILEDFFSVVEIEKVKTSCLWISHLKKKNSLRS